MNDDQILEFVAPYTLCDSPRVKNALDLVEYVIQNNIPGDLVEIGVFKGGIIMAMALKCQQLGASRTIHAYDTFTGMTPAKEEDVNIHNLPATELLNPRSQLYSPGLLCDSSLESTKENISKTGYSNIQYHKGDIVKTLPYQIPNEIAVLRLDTDWYESTKFELEHFEPKVSQNGFVSIDDYGHWKGCRKAVDDFLQKHPYNLLPIDYTGVYWQKSL